MLRRKYWQFEKQIWNHCNLEQIIFPLLQTVGNQKPTAFIKYPKRLPYYIELLMNLWTIFGSFT